MKEMKAFDQRRSKALKYRTGFANVQAVKFVLKQFIQTLLLAHLQSLCSVKQFLGYPIYIHVIFTSGLQINNIIWQKTYHLWMILYIVWWTSKLAEPDFNLKLGLSFEFDRSIKNTLAILCFLPLFSLFSAFNISVSWCKSGRAQTFPLRSFCLKQTHLFPIRCRYTLWLPTSHSVCHLMRVPCVLSYLGDHCLVAL